MAIEGWRRRAAANGSKRLVRAKGLEPPRLSSPEPKSGASTNFATPAHGLAAPSQGAVYSTPPPRTIGKAAVFRRPIRPSSADLPAALIAAPDPLGEVGGEGIERQQPLALRDPRIVRTVDPDINPNMGDPDIVGGDRQHPRRLDQIVRPHPAIDRAGLDRRHILGAAPEAPLQWGQGHRSAFLDFKSATPAQAIDIPLF